jgi:alkylhydroperoxidase/carboxymuconolactone decarboxylase family protein YurZ
MIDGPVLPSPAELTERLTALRAGRGFLLPHYGAMAAAAPDLCDAYGAMYTALTLTQRHLIPLEKEFVWLAILVALRESVGTHHVALFKQAGGTEDQARLAFQLAGYAGAGDSFAFLDQHWQAQFPGIDPAQGYLQGMRGLSAGLVPAGFDHLAMAAVQAALGKGWAVRTHIIAAYEAGVAEEKLVEAMSLIIWPAGVNRFVAAATIWHGLMRDGVVTPSPLFQAWADMPGQGAYQAP